MTADNRDVAAVDRLDAQIRSREAARREGHLVGTYISIEPEDAEALLTLARQSIDAQKRVEGHLCPNCGAFTVAALNSTTALGE